MLGLMRKLTRNKLTGGLLLGIVILSMAVWGVENIFTGNFGSSLYQAGERTMDERQLNQRFENYLTNVRREQPGNAMTRQQAVEQGILDQIFNFERSRLLQLGYARQTGADASVDAVASEVTAMEAFINPVTDEFDPQQYRSRLATIDIGPAEFEQDVQDNLTLDYLTNAAEAAIAPPGALARIQAIYENESRDISWFILDKSALPAPEAPTEEEVAAYYEGHESLFREAERRSLSFLTLSAEVLLDREAVAEEDIIALYEATRTSRLATPDQRTFLQAVYESEEDALNAFGVLSVGGEIEADQAVNVQTRTGVIDDITIEELKETIFVPTAAAGTLAGPYQTEGGWLIARLDEIIPGTPKTLEEAREEIVTELANSASFEAYYAALNTLDDLIGQGLTLGEMAGYFGLSVADSVRVDANGRNEEGVPVSDLAQAPEALAQAFELPQGEVTDAFEVGEATLLISIDEIIPQSVPPLEEVTETAETLLIAEQEGEALQNAAERLVEEVMAGERAFTQIAAAYEAEVQTAADLRRSALDRTVPQLIVREAFRLNEGEIQILQGPLPTQVTLLKLDQLSPPDEAQLDVLATLSAPRLTEQLKQDMLTALAGELEEGLETRTNMAGFNFYKNRLLEDQ